MCVAWATWLWTGSADCKRTWNYSDTESSCDLIVWGSLTDVMWAKRWGNVAGVGVEGLGMWLLARAGAGGLGMWLLAGVGAVGLGMWLQWGAGIGLAGVCCMLVLGSGAGLALGLMKGIISMCRGKCASGCGGRSFLELQFSNSWPWMLVLWLYLLCTLLALKG